MKLWLDDVRDPKRWGRKGWTWVRTPTEARDLVLRAHQKGELITAMSLDHDLGGEVKDLDSLPDGPFTLKGRIHYPEGLDPEGTGYLFAGWVRDNDLWPTERMMTHSASDFGAARILSVVREKFPNAAWVHINGRLREEQFR